MKRWLSICLYGWFFWVTLISSTQAFQFAVISDVRADALDKVLEFIASRKAEVVLVPGDYYYDRQEYYSHFVKSGFDVSPKNTPDRQSVYFAIGNHDEPPAGDDFFRKAIAPCYPNNGPATSPRGTVFSFNRGDCHFVITDQYWDDSEGGYSDTQLKWLEQDLKASDQPFKFVFGHEPVFPLSRHVKNSLDANPMQRDRFWQILADTGAQAFFCGHTHNLSHVLYKGVYQIDNGEVRDGGPICVTIVDVTEGKAVVKSYQTDGSVPEAEKDSKVLKDLVARTVIDATVRPVGSNAPVVLFSAGAAKDQGWVGQLCFIGSLLYD